MKKSLLATFVIIALLLCGCAVTHDPNESAYNNALTLLSEGRTEDAYNAFSAIKGYRDSSDYLDRFTYVITEVQTKDYGFGDLPATETQTYTYDGDGNLLRHEGKYAEDAGPSFSEEYSYEKGLRTRTEAQSEAGYSTITYEYDKSGRLIRRVGTTDGANVGGITLYEYDNDGNCVKVSGTSYHGIDTSEYNEDTAYHSDVTTFTYDEVGNCIGSVCDYGDSGWTYTATYDGDGNVLSLVCVSGDGDTSTTTFTYNDGNCVRIETDYGAETFEYDDSGRITASIFTQQDEVASKSTYVTALIYCKNGAPKIPEHLRHYYSGINPFE